VADFAAAIGKLNKNKWHGSKMFATCYCSSNNKCISNLFTTTTMETTQRKSDHKNWFEIGSTEAQK